ncbi:MAG: YfcE family phosphodiesterase [Clostridia bacterium]|nr:YfcE family phosphodiesterase [Clostridia bacterium]
MKIFVFSDLHGHADAMQAVVGQIKQHNPNKVVFCGDLFGGWSAGSRQTIAEYFAQIDATLYLVRGNNDRYTDSVLLPTPIEDNAIMHHFGRTLFFTHGDLYNKWRVPPVLRSGDVLVHGHTHIAGYSKASGLTTISVGSVALPRDNTASYVILQQDGISYYDLLGNLLLTKPW